MTIISKELLERERKLDEECQLLRLLYNCSAFSPLKQPEHLLRSCIDEMIKEGSRGPCAKSKRVSAIISCSLETYDGISSYPYIIATNTPPGKFVCLNNEACKANCNKVCVHAEENVILKAFQYRTIEVAGGACLHLKIVDGKPVPSGKPSCVYCSRKILQSGLKYMFLFHETGWCRYTAEEFHEHTLRNLELPCKT